MNKLRTLESDCRKPIKSGLTVLRDHFGHFCVYNFSIISNQHSLSCIVKTQKKNHTEMLIQFKQSK